jgi:hypothetical protein
MALALRSQFNDRTDEALCFAELGFPIIPVTLTRDSNRWRKQPRVEWTLATIDAARIAGWWRLWPEALPAIPLRYTNLVVVDADTPGRAEELKTLRVLGPHSKIATPSGGLHMVFAQPDPPITKHRWCEGVEVLGTSCLLTCYDLEELRFPRVAPRAVLPELFRKPRGESGWRIDEEGFVVREASTEPHGVPINKDRPQRVVTPKRVAEDAGSMTDALFALDPADWRGEHDRWLSLMNAAKWLGIAEDDFVRWSLGDPAYAADERAIRRKWDSLTPTHGGALYAALSEAGIKVAAKRNIAANRSLIDRHPLGASANPCDPNHARQPTRDWRSRINTVLDKLRAKPDGDMLFWAGCRVAEVMADVKKPLPSIAMQLLEGACPEPCKTLGREEVQRVITNAFYQIEKEELEAEEVEVKST